MVKDGEADAPTFLSENGALDNAVHITRPYQHFMSSTWNADLVFSAVTKFWPVIDYFEETWHPVLLRSGQKGNQIVSPFSYQEFRYHNQVSCKSSETRLKSFLLLLLSSFIQGQNKFCEALREFCWSMASRILDAVPDAPSIGKYVVTAQRPTAIRTSCVGHFTSPEHMNLIIS